MKNDYPIPRNILDAFDMAGLMKKMAKADWYYEYTDDPDVWERGRKEINGIQQDLLAISKMPNGLHAANYLWEAYVPVYSINKPAFLIEQELNISSFQNNSIMNEKNFDYLSNQLKYSGFGESHTEELKTKMQKGQTDFVIPHQQEFGNDSTASVLHFKKSDESGMYFFNKYSLAVSKANSPDVTQQTFYINNKEDNITLKEAYNLMQGRAVYKNLSNKENEKYKAWVQLDFKETDSNSNFKLKKFNENYGFDLVKELSKHPIKELETPKYKESLIESLQRGNRQSVTFSLPDKEVKMFIEASPKFKSLNLYDNNMKRVLSNSLNGESKGSEQSVKQEAKKESMKGDSEEGGPAESSQKKPRRKRQSIS